MPFHENQIPAEQHAADRQDVTAKSVETALKFLRILQAMTDCSHSSTEIEEESVEAVIVEGFALRAGVLTNTTYSPPTM